MENKKAKESLILKFIGLLFLPLIIFFFSSFLLYPFKPHCSLGGGILGCISECEPRSYFDDGRPASYKEIPCFHDDPTTLQLFMFNQTWFIPLVFLILMIFTFFLVYKLGIKKFFKNLVYIAFAPFFVLKENRKNKNLISRIFILILSFFLLVEWLTGYYFVFTTLENAWNLRL